MRLQQLSAVLWMSGLGGSTIYMPQLKGSISPFTFQGKWDYFCKKDIFVELMLHMFELFPKRCIHQCLKHFESSVL